LTTTSLFDVIVDGAAAESALWSECLRPRAEREPDAVFSPLVPDAGLAVGLETIYEGYLLHYGRPRLFAPPDDDVALLLGDTLLAHGLVRVAATGDVEAVRDLAELLSLCAQARADALPGDGPAWAATAARLGRGGLEPARDALRDRRDAGPLETIARSSVGDEAVDRALAAHAARVL
jgi:hypothetical protein